MTENYEAYAVWSVVASSVIFAAVIVWIFTKYLAPAVASAQNTRNEEIAQAQLRRDEAVAELERVRKEQQTLEEQLAQMRLRAQSDAQRERDHILQEARNDGDHVIRNAEGELSRARHHGENQIRHDLLARAVVHARERAMREIDADLDARIVMSVAQSIGKDSGNSFVAVGDAQHGV
jgi:F-type H+-transporting ATPase subunit b